MLFSTGLPRKRSPHQCEGKATPKRNSTPWPKTCHEAPPLRGAGRDGPRRGKASRGGICRRGQTPEAQFRLVLLAPRCGWRTGWARSHRAARPRPAFARVICPGHCRLPSVDGVASSIDCSARSHVHHGASTPPPNHDALPPRAVPCLPNVTAAPGMMSSG